MIGIAFCGSAGSGKSTLVKQEAKILDATAGNRCMWKTRQDNRILWIDIEPELNTPPDRLLDCRNTDYPDEYFYGIFFDPPHEYGREKNTTIFTTPSKKIADEKWPDYPRPNPRYYGADKYATKDDLIKFISDAQLEFNRILNTQHGMLWLKWNERRIKLSDILAEFSERWLVMLKICVERAGETAAQTWWILLMKKEEPT